MAESLKGITERIMKEYKQEASEIEHTVPTCDTCLLSADCAQEYQTDERGWIGNNCKDFVPRTWKEHIFFNGEWWS